LFTEIDIVGNRIRRRARSNGCFLKPNALSARLASWKCLDGNLDWMSQAMLEMMNPKNPLFGKPVSVQPERFRNKTRYQWTICRAQAPDELISWGHAASQHEAESAARDEVLALSSGATQGGRVKSTITPFTKRVNRYRR